MPGLHYNLDAVVENEERYDVSTGVRRRGSYILDKTNLSVGSVIPSFAPIYADLKLKTCQLVRNMKVYEAYTTGDVALTIKVAKGSFPYTGMFIGNGSKGATVTGIDTSNASYDVLTISAAFGVNLAVGDVIFEATAAGGTKQKYTANSALYERKLIDQDICNIALLRTAAEIEPDKLVIPFSVNDKAAMTWFQFNE